MTDVRWSKQALEDLDAIGDHVERTSRQYARALVARLYEATERLAEFPLPGREVPETGLEHVRELIRDGYRIVYVVLEGRVEVLAVLHGQQDLRKKLRRE